MNFVDRYVQYASKLTESPRLFHYFLGYLLLSQVVGRNATYSGATYDAGPNLWLVLIGPSSQARKSSTWKITTDLLNDVFQDRSYILPAGGSYESFLEAWTLRKDESGTACGLVVHDEFKNLNDWIGRDYNIEMKGFLTQAYDQTEVHRRVGTRTKATEYIIPHPFLNIVCATTPKWFYSSINEEKILGGFIPRFTIVCSNEQRPYIPRRPMPDLLEREALINELKRVRELKIGRMDYDEDAAKMHDKWHCHFRDKKRNAHEALVPFISRRVADVHKFAQLNCIMRGGAPVMNSADLDSAIAIIENLIEYTEDVISDRMALTPFQDDRNKVIDLIRKFSNGNGGAVHSKVLRYSRLDKKRFRDIIETLDEERTIKINREATATNKGTYYELQEEETDDAERNALTQNHN